MSDNLMTELLEKLRMLRFDYEMDGSLEFAILDIAMELEERIGALESENAKLREADAVNDLALSYVAIKADRDACKALAESYMAENDALYMENVKLESRAADMESFIRDMRASLIDGWNEETFAEWARDVNLDGRMRALGLEADNGR